MNNDYRYDFNLLNLSFHDYGDEIKKIFAFRDFSAQHVFQRRFFAEFGFDKTLTDDEILFHEFGFIDIPDEVLPDEALNHPAMIRIRDASNDDLEHITEKLSDLIYCLDRYLRRIHNHCQRLERYITSTATVIADGTAANIEKTRSRYKLGRELNHLYWNIYHEIKFLLDKVNKAFKKIDDKVQHVYRKIFADRLKSARRAAKMSQTEFGAICGLSQRVISGYEVASREPTLATLVKFSKKLKRPIGWFLGES